MRPWSFWSSRANSLPIKPHQDSQAKSSLAGKSEPSWATGAPGGWDQQTEPQSVSQSYITQPEDSIYQVFGRPLVLNRMDSPLQEPDDSVSSIIHGVHEDEAMELVAAIKELREQATRDVALIAELRGQAEDNAHAIGVARIENERLMKELSAAVSEARVAAAAAAASAAAAAAAATTAAAAAAAASATGTAVTVNSPPTHGPPTHSPPPHSPPTRSPPIRSPPTHSPPTHSSPLHSPPLHSPPTDTPTRSPSTDTPPSPPKTGKKKKPLKQAPPVSTPSSPKTTYTKSPTITAAPQPTPSSPNLTIFETYDRMVNILKTKPRTDVQLGDYPWPMFPEPAGSFPRRITLRSDVEKEKVFAFVQAYTSAYGPGQRDKRGDAMVKAWKSIMGRSDDIILNGTVARAFTYMDMAAQSQ